VKIDTSNLARNDRHRFIYHVLSYMDNRSVPKGLSMAHVTHLARTTLDVEKFRHCRPNIVKCGQQAGRRLSFVDRTCDGIRPSICSPCTYAQTTDSRRRLGGHCQVLSTFDNDRHRFMTLNVQLYACAVQQATGHDGVARSIGVSYTRLISRTRKASR